MIYPSLGDLGVLDPRPEAGRARAVEVLNDWAIEFQRTSPRFVCAATMPLLDVDDAVAEIAPRRRPRASRSRSSRPASRSTCRRTDHDVWHPVWAALEETGTRARLPHRHRAARRRRVHGVYYRGPGGAVLNYVETTYGGQRARHASSSRRGALDRHPDLKVLVSEGGATWGPFLADRMDEAYRQHGFALRPKLSKLPSEYLYEQVYASFQHDRSAVAANSGDGLAERDVGQRLPAPRGHVRPHARRRCTSCSTTSTTRRGERITVGAFAGAVPARAAGAGYHSYADCGRLTGVTVNSVLPGSRHGHTGPPARTPCAAPRRSTWRGPTASARRCTWSAAPATS